MSLLKDLSNAMIPGRDENEPPLSFRKLALLHRWPNGTIATGYPKIKERYSEAELIKMSGKATYQDALNYFDLIPDGKTTLPPQVSLREILARHSYPDLEKNKFRFLTYNSYLLEVPFPFDAKSKPLLSQRGTRLGKAIKRDYDIASLYEIFSDDVWKYVNKAWLPGLVSSNRGIEKSGLACINQKGIIVNRQLHTYESKGTVDDSDWHASKGVMLTVILTEYGCIEIFSTHLFFGGGLIGNGSSPIARSKTKIDEVKELLSFYNAFHSKSNVAIIVGDFNIDANANLNRKDVNQEEYAREYIQLKKKMAAHNLYDLWIWDVYERMPNSGFTTRFTDEEPPDKNFGGCSLDLNSDFCNDDCVPVANRMNIGEGRLDYVFIQKPEATHTFNLDVSKPRRRAFKMQTKDDDHTEEFLSDHLGISFDIFVSPKAFVK